MKWKILALIIGLGLLCAGALSLLIIMKEGSPADRATSQIRHKPNPKPKPHKH